MEKESVFISSIRAFFKFFFSAVGLFIGLLITVFIFSLIAGKTMEEKTQMVFLPDARYHKEVLPQSAPVILKIDINGIIGTQVTAKEIKHQLVESRLKFLKNNRVKGILLSINTPGGTITDSDSIYQMLKEYKDEYNLPIITFVDGMCASGGMYIACATDKITTTPVSVVGSIGVKFGPFFNVSEGLKKIGIHTQTYTSGSDKDMLSPFAPHSDEKYESLQSITNFFYERFLQIVLDARPKLSKDQLINELGAHIFDPEKAAKIGLIDEGNYNYSKALTHVVEKAGLDPEKPYQVVQLLSKKRVFQQFIDGAAKILSGKIQHEIILPGQTDFQSPISYYYDANNVR